MKTLLSIISERAHDCSDVKFLKNFSAFKAKREQFTNYRADSGVFPMMVLLSVFTINLAWLPAN